MAKSMARAKTKTLYNDTRSGFTIIEVVLVLAIAGLIFLMVFIALPQLQRAQRDTQRRDAIASFQSAITQFQVNNNGRIPGQGNKTSKCDPGDSTDMPPLTEGNEACRMIVVYLNGADDDKNGFIDPDGTPYKVNIMGEFGGTQPSFGAAGESGLDHTIYMYTKAGCNGEEVVKANNARDFALVYRLEGSGIYCHGNND